MAPQTIEREKIASLDIVRRILPWREQLATGFGTGHGNADLQLIDVLIVLLAAFYNPLVRSQRLIEALSSQTWMQQQTGLERVARSTLSDALQRFDPEQLKPLIRQLTGQVAALGQRDPDLAGLTRQVIAADGTYLNLAGEVLWALQCRRGHGQKSQARARLDLQLDVQSFTLLEGRVSGQEDSSEAAAFIKQLKAGVIYLVDRNFVHFGFLGAVLEKGSNFVMRCKKSVCFQVAQTRELCAKDKELSILRDESGTLSGPTSASNKGRSSRTCKPPTVLLRRVVVWDPSKNEEVMLLTDLLDVPAWVIAVLYRRRWLIELFLRFLKCTAAMNRPLSKSPQGITLQLYVAMIATLLLHLATGRKVSKYSLFWINAVAAGQATWEQMEVGLARIEREKTLEKARLKRKKLLAPGLGAKKSSV